MQEASKELGQFQIELSKGRLAKVTPSTATEVFSCISYLEDKPATLLARQVSGSEKTMQNYCDRGQTTTPNFNKFVHLMQRLGYEVYLKKASSGDV